MQKKDFFFSLNKINASIYIDFCINQNVPQMSVQTNPLKQAVKSVKYRTVRCEGMGQIEFSVAFFCLFGQNQ